MVVGIYLSTHLQVYVTVMFYTDVQVIIEALQESAAGLEKGGGFGGSLKTTKAEGLLDL